MFTLSRNPLYVGNLLIYAGVFLLHGALPMIVLGMGFYVFVYYCIVFAEEAYLREKFGEQYEAYCKETPRWLPEISRFAKATEGMEFNLRRVILKDYPTIASTVVMLALTEMYDAMLMNDFSHHGTVLAMEMLIAVSIVFAVLVRTLKKRKIVTENQETPPAV